MFRGFFLLLLHSYKIRTRKQCGLNFSTKIRTCVCVHLTKKGFKRECHRISIYGAMKPTHTDSFTQMRNRERERNALVDDLPFFTSTFAERSSRLKDTQYNSSQHDDITLYYYYMLYVVCCMY